MDPQSTGSHGPVDLLLINGSNYPGHAVFPYAFVQVSALARKHGLRVKRLELLPFSPAKWSSQIEHAIRQHRPRMVGTHVRQADAQYLPEYARTPGNDDAIRTYFPVENTRAILQRVRELSDAPTIVGGFGFTAQSAKLVERLQPDFGVQGEPDAVFENFERILALANGRQISDLSDIPNLVFRDEGTYRFNHREFYGPLDAPEYNDEIFSELLAFYAALGRSVAIGNFAEADVPVEIMRGCPCSCYFCTEPTVKGRRIRRRDLDSIMQDVEFLGNRNVHSIFFICSELNMGGMDFPLQLAERMLRFNEKRPGREVRWKAYAMPRPGMTREQLKLMMRAGYFPGWNEFASFDDANLKKCRMPYRTEHVVRYFRDILDLAENDELYQGPPLLKFEMFLGNAFSNASAIRETLRVVDEQGFSRRHQYGGTISATRVYELDGRLTCGTEDTAFSVNWDGRQDFDPTWPSFYYSPELLAALGNERAVEEFLAFVADTLLSTSYQARQGALRFLQGGVFSERLSRLLRQHPAGFVCTVMLNQDNDEDDDSNGAVVLRKAGSEAEAIWREPSVERLQALYGADPAELPVAELAARQLLSVLFQLNADDFEAVTNALGLPAPKSVEYRELTPYRLMRALYARFDSESEVLEYARRECGFDEDSIQELQLRYLLYSHAVRIEPLYRELLFDTAPRSDKVDVPLSRLTLDGSRGRVGSSTVSSPDSFRKVDVS